VVDVDAEWNWAYAGEFHTLRESKGWKEVNEGIGTSESLLPVRAGEDRVWD